MSQLIEPAASETVFADVRRALDEDIGTGDVSAALLPDEVRSARIISREDAVIAGGDWFEASFRALDPTVHVHWLVRDGDEVSAGACVCELQGQGAVLVSAERCALNFLQTLSATATQTRRFVRAVEGTGCTILDTRKTLPGLRMAQKYAVRCGGASNHRIGLFDAVMIKENHVLACGSITAAVARARERSPRLPVIVEVENLAELAEALDARPQRILLDEFDLDQMREAVDMARSRCALEASGGIDLASIRSIAETGVQFISVGAITKHVRAIDLSMRLLPR